MKPSSFCTIATNGAMKDLLALVQSMSLNMPGSRLYVLCDATTKEYIENDHFPLNINIYWNITLNKYTNKNREQMEKDGIWSSFQMEKTNSLLWAFEKGEPDVMFLDADLFILSPIKFENYKGEDVILSPHNIRKVFEDRYGKYNGGVFWTKNKSSIQTWRDHFEGSRYYDQACLEDVAKHHTIYETHDGQNMSWWRIFQSDLSPQDLVSKFCMKDDILYYDDNIVQFIHTHLYDDMKAHPVVRKMTLSFNKLMFDILIQRKDIRNALLIQRFIKEHWTIVIPKQPVGGLWNHDNDSFRELAKMWSIKKLVKFEEVPQIGNCWFGGPGACLLYDRPTLQWYSQDPLAKNAKISLFGNPQPPESSGGLPWIFWARKPVILESKKLKFRSNKKEHNVVFIGNIENSVQGSYRSNSWGDNIDDFHLTNGGKYKFTHEEYLDRISHSKFGLCLRGFGAKCHRETELMGVGTIPLITHECDVSSYANPLKEGIHYVRVNEPSDIPDIIEKITPEKVEEMKNNCIQWWEQNCSLEGSFRTTLKQIFNL